MDLKLLGEIYTKGSWGVSAETNYNNAIAIAAMYTSATYVPWRVRRICLTMP